MNLGVAVTVTKATLVEALSEELGLSKCEAKELAESVFEELSATLASGEPVKLWGFGNFALRDKTGRICRNPNTGAEALISPRRVVTFRPGRKLQRRVLGYTNGIEPRAPRRLPLVNVTDECHRLSQRSGSTSSTRPRHADSPSAGDD